MSARLNAAKVLIEDGCDIDAMRDLMDGLEQVAEAIAAQPGHMAGVRVLKDAYDVLDDIYLAISELGDKS